MTERLESSDPLADFAFDYIVGGLNSVLDEKLVILVSQAVANHLRKLLEYDLNEIGLIGEHQLINAIINISIFPDYIKYIKCVRE